MSIAMPNLVAQVELSATAPRITFGRGPRVLVLPGKWQRIAAAVLINADYTIIETESTATAVQADVIVDTNSDRKHGTDIVSYTPDNIAGFLSQIASRTASANRFSHIVSL